MRIVLDTNVLLSCISRKSAFRPIWDAFLLRKYQMAISIDIFFEYLEKLEQKTSTVVAANISEAIITSRSIVIVQYWLRWRVIDNDPDDNKFFDIAIASNSDYLVTNDAHFNIAKRTAFPSIKIISSLEFLQILNSL